jgi:hypothetical protein
VHEMTTRHRRKAGSGPPANALIAWISSDPHLRSVAASHRRGTGASLSPHTRAAKAAVAACLALAGGGILGITTIVNDGLVAPLATKPSPVLNQDAEPGRAAAGGPGAGIQPNPMIVPAPVTTESMVVHPPSPRPPVAAAANAPTGPVAADGPSCRPRQSVGSSVTLPEAHSVAPHRVEPLHPGRSIAPIKLADAGKPDSAGTLASSADAGDSAAPADPGTAAGSNNPVTSTDNPGAAGNSTDPSKPAGPTDSSGTASAGDTSKPGDSGERLIPGTPPSSHKSTAAPSPLITTPFGRNGARVSGTHEAFD